MHRAKSTTGVWQRLFFLALFHVSILKAQEPIGLINDNYMPASSVLMNPAAAFSSPIPWDINVIRADVLVNNNFAFANHLALLTLLGNNTSNQSVDYNSPNTIRIFSNARIQGPSIVFQQNSFSYGILTQVRSAASLVSDRVPSNLDLNNILDDSSYQFPANRGAGLNWMQVGINLGRTINVTGEHPVYAGLNINYLAGWDGISEVTEQPLNFKKHPNSDTILFNDVLMNYGYTSGFSNDVGRNLTTLKVKGSGASIDAGVWVTDGNDPVNYRWKAGVSLVDIGFISFSKNVQRYQLTTDTTVSASLNSLKNLQSADAFTQLASQTVASKGSLESKSGALEVWLPAAIVFQGEITLPNHFFIHGLVVQRIVLSQQQVLRPNSITITPRYETKQFAAGIPIDWYDYHRVQVGGYIRIGAVIVGSDNLAALVVPAKWEGADFYVGLHVYPFRSQNGLHLKSGKISCPKF